MKRPKSEVAIEVFMALFLIGCSLLGVRLLWSLDGWLIGWRVFVGAVGFWVLIAWVGRFMVGLLRLFFPSARRWEREGRS
jgi:hypothetical protein